VPTYVYRFVDTGETIEVQQSFDDATLTETTHPVTGATMQVKKVFQPVGVTFRGTGFYKTDSRGSSSTPGKSSTSPPSDGAKSDKSESSPSTTTSTPAPSSSSTSD
jgi:predicted nucleic acid-binding Zn ribbon protein